MGVHHIALLARDLAATHRFYSEVMGFTLVKVMAVPLKPGSPGSWARHAFYRTGARSDADLIAFWELNDPALREVRTDISTALGLPAWVNHLAFEAPSAEALEGLIARWLDHGLEVTEVDHEFCRSIYTMDPNGIMVEYCLNTRPFTDEEMADAERLLLAPTLPLSGAHVKVHRPAERA